MCGIYGLITDEYKDFKTIIKNVKASSNHRGPDSLGHMLIKVPETNTHILLVHTRLHINGDSKKQPISNSTGTILLIINGEIFNWHDLEKELNFKCTQSDCEIIIPLYEKYKDKYPVEKANETEQVLESFIKEDGTIVPVITIEHFETDPHKDKPPFNPINLTIEN